MDIRVFVGSNSHSVDSMSKDTVSDLWNGRTMKVVYTIISFQQLTATTAN